MGALVVGLLLLSCWLLLRAVRTGRGHGAPRAWGLALVVLLLSIWYAAEELVVGSGELARTLDRVYVVSAPDDVPGPLGLVAGAELALGVELHTTLADRDREDDVETTGFEVAHRLLGLPVGRACVQERLTGDDVAEASRSYVVTAGGCD